MTSMPASRSARAMTFAPRSCPSRPGLAMTTRIGRAMGPDYTGGPEAAVARRRGGRGYPARGEARSMRDPYATIGVGRDAPLDEVRATYRQRLGEVARERFDGVTEDERLG